MTITVDVTGTIEDAAAAGNPKRDRFIIRARDNNNNIIASGGFSVALGDRLNSSFSMTLGTNDAFGVVPSSDIVVAATERPFTLEIVESDTKGVGTSPYVPTGGALVTSATFDPAGGGNFTAACTGLPGGVITDATPPVVTVPANITVNTGPGSATANVSYTVTATDDVDGPITPTRTAGLASGAAFPVGTTTVTYQATDAAGNTGTASFTVTVVDNQGPVITVPPNISVSTDPNRSTAVVTFTVSANDLVDGAITPTSSHASGATFPFGTTTVTVSARDNAGNTSTASFTVTVNDTQPPTVILPPDITANTDPGSDTAVVTFPIVAFDNVALAGGVTLTAGLPPHSAFPVGTTVVTYEVRDISGNIGTASFNVTIVDAEAPIQTIPSDISVSTDPGAATAVVNFAVSATDNVDGAITPVVTSSPTAGLTSGSAFPVGVTTLTVTSRDTAGNSSTGSFNVTVSDTEPPVLTVPADIVTNTDPGSNSAVVSYATPTATDNLPGVTVSLVSGPASGSAFPAGATTVTYEARDVAGNVTTDSFTVTVSDGEVPVVTVPADISVNTDPGLPTAVVNFAVSATDNVDGAITPVVTSSPTAGLDSGSAFPVGTTMLTVTATDNAGNMGSRTFNVTVSDGEAPVLTVPADIVTNTDPGSNTAVVNYPAPTATDNAPGVSVNLVSGPAPGAAFPTGVTTVTYEARDAAGNVTTDSFTVTVTDSEQPVITVPADIAVGTDPGLATAVVNFAVSATDNVDGALAPVVSSSPMAGLVSGSAFPVGTTTITVTATDNAGNTGSDSFTVTVSDDEAPVFTSTQPNLTREINFDQTSAVVTFPTPGATDNLGAVTVTQTQGPASGAAFPLGTTLVEFTATDGAGLTAVMQFTVTVSTIPPGVVTFIVNSPDDGTVTFTSAEPALNTSVVVTGGSGRSSPIQLVPGSYTANYVLPGGFALTAANCSSASGSVDISSKLVTMTFARGESYTCTFTGQNIGQQTTDQIQQFMDSRARLIMANRPDRQRRLARVRGESNPQTVTMFGHSPTYSFAALGVDVAEDAVHLSFSSTSASRDPLTARADWDVWMEAAFSKYESGRADGRFGILHAGADYRIGESEILGFALQIDRTTEDQTGSNASTSGTGWMVGPYYTAQLTEGLYLDANLLYGKAKNEVSPLGTYSDSFDSTRWMLYASLFGSIDKGNVNIQPSFSVNYFEERSDAYVDSLSVPIAAVTTSLGDIDFGTRVTWNDPLGQYSNYVELDGIYTIEASGSSATQSLVDEGLRAKVGVGGSLMFDRMGRLEYGLSYDGIGDSNYEAVTARVGFGMKF